MEGDVFTHVLLFEVSQLPFKSPSLYFDLIDGKGEVGNSQSPAEEKIKYLLCLREEGGSRTFNTVLTKRCFPCYNLFLMLGSMKLLLEQTEFFIFFVNGLLFLGRSQEQEQCLFPLLQEQTF